MARLAGKVAVITGAASGIGAATARRFAAEGAKILATDVQVERGEALAKELGATFLKHDVADPTQWEQVAATVQQQFGRLDVMFNCAGISTGKSIEDVDIATWNRIVSINLTGTMLGCQVAMRLMKQNPGGPSGSIINVASTTAFMGIPVDVGYTATKGAVRLLTKSVSIVGARAPNIRCNCIAPGPIRTDMLQPFLDAAPGREELTKGMTPMGRIADASEIAALVLFLASDEASFSTGAEFIADGGLLASHPGH